MKNLCRLPMALTFAIVGVIALTATVKPASAAPTFVGSFKVYDGPAWPTNPPVYSGQEAAALLFGGAPTDYFVSIDPSLDPLTITHTAWYDGWAEPLTTFGEGFHFDSGNPGYNDPGGVGTAWSAYVHDHENDKVNYVWKSDAVPPCNNGNVPVTPEPTSLALLGTGGLPLFGLIRRKIRA